MTTQKRLDLIESMVKASRKSQQNNAFYYILWGLLMSAVSLIEFYCAKNNLIFWQAWPVAGLLGGIASAWYGHQQGKKSEVNTTKDIVSSYLWGSFVITLIFLVAFTVSNHIHPHSLILSIAGLCTFSSGGVSRFKPLLAGGIALWIGAILCGFVITNVNISLVYALSLILGFVVPGFILRKKELNEAE